MYDAFSVRGRKLEPERACTLLCSCGARSKQFVEDMMNLVLLFSSLKFLELWLSHKRLAPCCACTYDKRPNILLRTRTLRPDNAAEPVHHQNRTKRGSRANCQRWEHLPALITFKFSAKITHSPGILTPGDFHPDRSGGHVVPR